MPILPTSGKRRALREATLYKKAWVVAAAWVGHMPSNPAEMQIPSYETWSRKDLEAQVRALIDDFGEYLNHILGKRRTKGVETRALHFLAKYYDDVFHTKGPFSLCTVHEFESLVGPLPESTLLEAPPYTEILFQGFRGMAFRHPEYMLARDVEFNYDLFWQTEELVEKHMAMVKLPLWMSAAVENVQGLARGTILSCFSLIESTVSGLARAHDMTTKGIDSRERKRLLDPHGGLIQRLLTVPTIITGRPPPLSVDSLPISKLFGEIKQRRDAFMHCEPGGQESRQGFVKQDRFHDVSSDVVDDAVKLTVETVRILWRHVHDTEEGPLWLRKLGDRSAYRRGLKIVPNV
jgi:hypothetical protein